MNQPDDPESLTELVARIGTIPGIKIGCRLGI
jgi:hypothetical protein